MLNCLQAEEFIVKNSTHLFSYEEDDNHPRVRCLLLKDYYTCTRHFNMFKVRHSFLDSLWKYKSINWLHMRGLIPHKL